MGYYLKAIICRDKMSREIIEEYNTARRIKLENDIFLIPFTDEFYDEFNQFMVLEAFDKFIFLNERMYHYLSNKSIQEPIAYIETDYFGGNGVQSAMMFDKEKIIYDIRHEHKGYGAINLVLKELGIVKALGKDEWDTANLFKHRNTEDWLDDAENI